MGPDCGPMLRNPDNPSETEVIHSDVVQLGCISAGLATGAIRMMTKLFSRRATRTTL